MRWRPTDCHIINVRAIRSLDLITQIESEMGRIEVKEIKHSGLFTLSDDVCVAVAVQVGVGHKVADRWVVIIVGIQSTVDLVKT